MGGFGRVATQRPAVGARARHAYLSVSCSKLGKVPHRGQSPPGRKVILFVF